jgi:RimJ/RimL family protein N-acetyltransferase
MSKDEIVFELPTCVVRPWARGDEPSLVRHANNRNVWINLRDSFPYPYTMNDASRWIDVASTKLHHLAFAITVGEFAVGGVGLSPRDDINRRSAEIGYWLGEAYWGRGITTEAVRVITGYGFDALEMNRIFAEVFAWNRASMRVLEKAGYTAEGRMRKHAIKDGQVIDQILFAVTRPDEEPNEENTREHD